MISYAQAREDVLLHRALHRVPYSEGFYVDVGAHDPNRDNATKHFYVHGWRGLNIEPAVELLPAFIRDRPRDINLQVAVTEQPGTVTFYEVEGPMGTPEDRVGQRRPELGLGPRTYTVPAMTLTQIFEQHAPSDIHFMKIDIDGHEAAAIRGMDFKRFRPWILVIRSTSPADPSQRSYQQWDSEVCAASYRMVLSDASNRYYIANEHADFVQYFMVPLDVYRDNELLEEVEKLQGRIADLEGLVGNADATEIVSPAKPMAPQLGIAGIT